MNNNNFVDRVIDCNDVMDILKCKKTTAYKFIKKANEEMKKEKFFLDIRGKTTLYYLYKVVNIKINVK